MKAKDVLQQMNEIEQTVYATQSWWPQLRRLLEQAEAVEASQLTPVAGDGATRPQAENCGDRDCFLCNPPRA